MANTGGNESLGQGPKAAEFRVGDPPVPTRAIRWGNSETSRRLSSIYGYPARLVSNIVVFGKGESAVARLHAEGAPVRPILAGDLQVSFVGDSTYKVEKGDVDGHFGITPGVKLIAVARKTMDEDEIGTGRSLAGIKSVSFKSPVEAGTELHSVWDNGAKVETGEVLDWTVSSGKVIIATMGLHYSENAPRHMPGVHVDPEYFVEAAAQAALLQLQHLQGVSDMARQRPLFEGIDEVKIRQAVPLGEEVTILMDLDTEKSGFVANAIVKKEDGSTAQVITGMKGLVGDRDRIDRLIGLKLTRLAAKR